MRLRLFSSVDLPQPDGPMSAVTWFSGKLKVDALQRMEILVVQIEVAHAHLDGRVGGRLLLDATVGRLALRLGHIGSRGRSGSERFSRA